LQEALRRLGKDARVYNFGQSGQYSTGERSLMERLLVAGHVPEVVIFIDGLNEYCYADDAPEESLAFVQLADGSRRPLRFALGSLFHALPVGRVATSLRRRLGAFSTPTPAIDEVNRRYEANRTVAGGAARAFGVKPLFVWQPVPAYGLDLARHPFAGVGLGRRELAGAGTRSMAARRRTLPPDESFFWAADLHDTAPTEGLLYIDPIHYSPAMSRHFAEALARALIDRKLLGS
jgi:hypothetical protein